MINRDSDLQQLISTCIQQIPPADTIKSREDVISSAMANTIVLVGNELMKGSAILLPTVHDSFCEFATAVKGTTNLGGEKDVQSLVTSRWILSNLTVHLQHHITYSRRVRKCGTIIYRPHSDLIPSLSKALWELHNIKRNTQYYAADTCVNDQLSTDTPIPENFKVLDTLNHSIHSQINSMLAQDSKIPFEYDELDIDKLVAEMNQTLWKSICILTQSESERRGTSKATDPSTAAYHIKKIRCFFLLCNVLFCTDDRCSFPLHTLVTDVVESQGGSALLIKILNRLGVCASSDTLCRFIQYKVRNASTKQTSHHPNDTFVVVSADNIDFLHSYARVFKGNQTSSWHGTSIQAVIPKLSLSLVVDLSI